jgi:hypothetical protein
VSFELFWFWVVKKKEKQTQNTNKLTNLKMQNSNSLKYFIYGISTVATISTIGYAYSILNISLPTPYIRRSWIINADDNLIFQNNVLLENGGIGPMHNIKIYKEQLKNDHQKKQELKLGVLGGCYGSINIPSHFITWDQIAPKGEFSLTVSYSYFDTSPFNKIRRTKPLHVIQNEF